MLLRLPAVEEPRPAWIADRHAEVIRDGGGIGF
jgi:hypothetical protein